MRESVSRIIDGIGLIFGLANLQETLGIIVLILTIFNILSTYVMKLYHNIKNKKYDEIAKDTEDTINKLNDLQNVIKKDEDNDNE